MIGQRNPNRPRKHALDGSGPIVDRCRAALRRVSEQFGEVTRVTRRTVSVRTSDGIELSLSYAPGNYVFSRVYNLTVSTPLPAGSAVPTGVRLSHRGRGGPRYASTTGETPDLRRLNTAAGPHLAGIDLVTSAVEPGPDGHILSLTPLGGSYVWVLIPPVFKATAFPPGEPERIIDLIRTIRTLTPAARTAPSAASAAPTKGPVV